VVQNFNITENKNIKKFFRLTLVSDARQNEDTNKTKQIINMKLTNNNRHC